MSTQLNAATRLRSATKVEAAPLSPEDHRTFMASLYHQLLKGVRGQNGSHPDTKKLLKLVNVKGYRAILVNHKELSDQGVDIVQEMKTLGWTKIKTVGKTTVMCRADGSFPILTGQDPSLDFETEDLWTLAQVDNIKDLKK